MNNTLSLTVIFFFFGVLFCLHDWRRGMLLCIVAGFLAGPLRKIIPGQPVYMVVMVGAFVAAVIAGFFVRHGSFRLRHLGSMYGALKIPVGLFLGWLCFEAVVSLVRYQSLTLVGIGLLSYLAPLPAFLLAYYFGLNKKSIIRFIKFYVLCAVLMLSGIYLSYFGIDWPVLKEIGSGVKIYVPGGVLDSYPGFFRSTEIAAWHAAGAICLLLTLIVSRGLRWPGLIVAALLLALLVAGFMTGRRKMLMEVVIFACFYGVLLTWFKKGVGRIVVIGLLMGGILGFVGLFGLNESSSVAGLNPYLHRGKTVFEDAESRFTQLGLESVGWAIQGYGIWGGGLGVASQGGQHFGGGAARFGGAGEGGLGKITAELGVPGLILFLWVLASLVHYLFRMIYILSAKKSPLVSLWYGLIAFLAANIPVFIVATQVFGDLFVLLLLGWIFGFAMAIYRVIIAREQSIEKYVDHNPRLQTEAGKLTASSVISS
jgi:hypothetical protein